jgi:hypothetical protein
MMQDDHSLTPLTLRVSCTCWQPPQPTYTPARELIEITNLFMGATARIQRQGGNITKPAMFISIQVGGLDANMVLGVPTHSSNT